MIHSLTEMFSKGRDKDDNKGEEEEWDEEEVEEEVLGVKKENLLHQNVAEISSRSQRERNGTRWEGKEGWRSFGRAVVGLHLYHFVLSNLSG